MEFRILGPIAVVSAGRQVQLSGPRQRALLTYLLLHAGEAVSGDRLLDELWAEPPRGGLAALQSQVSRLRKLVGDRIVTTGSGYAIRIEPGELDLDRFRALLAQAGASTDPAERSRLLREADSLWQGAPLAGVEAPFGSLEAAGLDELRLAALEDRIDADLACGHHDELAAELGGLVARHPLRERFHGQLILALYRCGRQADALEAYREMRRTLDEQLGLEPSLALRELERAILRQNPELDLASSTTATTAEVPPAARRARRRWVLAAALLAGAAISVVSVLLATGTSASPQLTMPPDAVGAIDPRSGRLVSVLPIGGTTAGLAAAGRWVWVGDWQDKTIARVDTQRLKVTQTIGLPIEPMSIAVGGGSVWIASRLLPSLVVLDARFGRIAHTLPLRQSGLGTFAAYDHGANDVAFGDGAAWLAHGLSAVSRVDASGRLKKQIFAGAVPVAVAFGMRTVWAVLQSSSRLIEINPDTNRVESSIPVGDVGLGFDDYPYVSCGLAVGAGSVWVAAHKLDRVWRIDPVSGRPSAIIPVGAGPYGIAVGAGSVWVANKHDGTVSQIDPNTNTVTRTIHLGGHPVNIAVGQRYVWVTSV